MARAGLVTGFEPFAGLPSNPADRVLPFLDGLSLSGLDVIARRIPVSFARTPAVLRDLVEEIRPAFVLSLGLAAGAPVPRVEMMAINAADAGTPDNDGAAPAGGRPFASGPAARRATWDGPAVVAAIAAAGLPARLSFHAGGHLCNLTLYTLLGLIGERGEEVPCGFLHLPHLPEEIVWMHGEADAGRRNAPWDLPSMSLQDQVKAVTAALETVAAAAARRST